MSSQDQVWIKTRHHCIGYVTDTVMNLGEMTALMCVEAYKGTGPI